MSDSIIFIFVSLAILAVGLYVFFCPQIVANKLSKFYSQYPLVHYAGEKQLNSRLFFIRLLGGVLMFVGLVVLYSSAGF